MIGKSERTTVYTASQADELRRQGKGKTDWDMSHEEAMRRRHADLEAPQPYEGWEETISIALPQPKEQVTLRLDREIMQWFRGQGRGYQTRINAVLCGYVEHERNRRRP